MKRTRGVAFTMTGSAVVSIHEDNELQLLCSVLMVGITSAILYTKSELVFFIVAEVLSN